MKFRDRRHNQYKDDGDEEKPPEQVGLRDRLAHFTWYVYSDVATQKKSLSSLRKVRLTQGTIGHGLRAQCLPDPLLWY